jgi:hypothetical protein
VTQAPTDHASAARQVDAECGQELSEPLCWRVHLARQHPEKLPAIVAIFVTAFAGVWFLFGNPIAAIVAVVLLLGATADFFLPVSYRLSSNGIAADSVTSHLRLEWPQVKRCLVSRDAVLLSPLSVASRLDNFRGIVLRYAPDGCPGDRESLFRSILAYRPDAAPQKSADAHPKEQT